MLSWQQQKFYPVNIDDFELTPLTYSSTITVFLIEFFLTATDTLQHIIAADERINTG
jgi:hypothetical protein